MMAPLIESGPFQTGSLDERRWQVMAAKAYEGATGIAPFVIAVRTTGISCRVGCPARRPHRHNVHLPDTTAEAVAAGYRTCERCHPDRGDLKPWQSRSKATPRTEGRIRSGAEVPRLRATAVRTCLPAPITR